MHLRKAFAYLIRVDHLRPRLLVFNSLEEPGLEVPKGAAEEGETFAEAVVRELREETGITGARTIRELGTTWYGNEEQRFFLLAAQAGLPDAFEHTVTGEGGDRGFRYVFHWMPVDPSLRAELVQGCGALVGALIDAVGWL